MRRHLAGTVGVRNHFEEVEKGVTITSSGNEYKPLITWFYSQKFRK